MRMLVVYYSRTGHTRGLAERIAAALGADLETIVDDARRSGVLGWLRSGFEAYFGQAASIESSRHDPSSYDVVAIGGPVWSRSMSSPVRAYLQRHRGRLPAVAFFYTCGGTGNERVFDQMAREGQVTPIATLAVREAELAESPARAATFCSEITRAVAAPPAPPRPTAPAPTPPPR